MSFMLSDILTAVAGLAACGVVGSMLKNYVETYCRDNEPIVWIWLEVNEPEGGHRIPTYSYGAVSPHA